MGVAVAGVEKEGPREGFLRARHRTTLKRAAMKKEFAQLVPRFGIVGPGIAACHASNTPYSIASVLITDADVALKQRMT